MKLTTKDIIKILPFNDALKTRLLKGFDTLNPDQKFMVEDVVWNTYLTIYKLRLQENVQAGLLRARNNKEKLDESFYDRMEEQTEKEMDSEGLAITEKVNLEAAQKAMELIVKEIQASKPKESTT